jgi:cobalt/nickel transport system permease protein
MSTHLLDRYIDGSSPVHVLDARVKLLLALGFIICASLLPVGSWLALTCLTALLWLAIVVSGIGLGTIIRRALVALPFLIVVVTIIFSVPGRPVFRVPLGLFTLTATDAGLLRFTSIIWKSWLSLQAALLLTATTHFLDVLRALRALRLPAVMVAILSFTYRYLYLLVDEAQRLMRARDCRSAAAEGKGGGTVLWRARVTGRLVGTLFLRSFERSERIYVAMLSRGYDGELRSMRRDALPRRDLLWGVGCATVLLVVMLQALLSV